MGFNSYAAGNKHYGGGRSAPNIGPVDPMGYKERDAKNRINKNAIMRRIKAQQSGNYMSADYLRRG